MRELTFNFVDDFGNDADLLRREGHHQAMLSCVRFMLDGVWEGLCEEVFPGTLDDDALRFFGLIAA